MKHRQFRGLRIAFTLTEILLAIAIVGVIAALVLPAVVTNYQNKALDIGYQRETRTIAGAVRNLTVSENKVDFFSTIMYSDTQPDGYDETSGKFIKKYLKVSKYCGDNNGDCFANEYHTYNETTHKKEVYEPVYKGACASLKNGASVCITPQIGADPVSVLIDVNGKKGPNVYGRDLLTYSVDMKVEKKSIRPDKTDVLATSESGLKPSIKDGPCAENSISKQCCDTLSVKKGDPCCIWYKDNASHPCYEAPPPSKNACETDPYGEGCCATKTSSITDDTHPCCIHDSIKISVKACQKIVDIRLNCHVSSLPSVGGMTNELLYCNTSMSPSVSGFQTTNGAKKYNIGQNFNLDLSMMMATPGNIYDPIYGDSGSGSGSSYKDKHFHYRLFKDGKQIFSQMLNYTQWNWFNVKYNVTLDKVLEAN